MFDLIERHGMDVPYRREGWIQGAHTEAGLAEVERRATQWAALGAPTRVLDKAETDRLLGTETLSRRLARTGAAARSSR